MLELSSESILLAGVVPSPEQKIFNFLTVTLQLCKDHFHQPSSLLPLRDPESTSSQLRWATAAASCAVLAEVVPILTLLIVFTHSERKTFDCLSHHLPGPIGHFQLLMTLCLIVEPQAPLDHAKRNMMGSARVVVAANLLFVPFAAMMLVVNSLFILDDHDSKSVLVTAKLQFVPFAAAMLKIPLIILHQSPCHDTKSVLFWL